MTVVDDPVTLPRAPATEAPPAPFDLPDRVTRSPYGYGVPRRYVWLADLLVLAGAFFLSHLVSRAMQPLVLPGGALHNDALGWLQLPGLASTGAFNALTDTLWIPIVMIPVTLFSVQLLGGYTPLLAQSRSRVFWVSVGSPLVGVSAVTLLLVGFKSYNIARLLMFSCALATMIGFLAHRAVVREYKRRRLNRGHYARNIIAIGPGAAVARLASHMAVHVPVTLFRLVGFLDPLRDGVAAGGPPCSSPSISVPCLGAASDLADLLVRHPVHEAIALESEGAARGWLDQVIERCDYFQITLRIVPEMLLAFRARDLQGVIATGPLQLPEIAVRPRHFDSDALFVKRVLDVCLSSLLLALLSPLFVLIAVAIKLTTPRLPVFYPWRVVGYKGRPFTGYKFTTMVANADEQKNDLMHMNEMSGPVFKIKDDPRITALGRILRKFSLNELPQLWSVLKGDMSLVGPRPAGPNELLRYELWHKRKLCVQPGITCLWQVRGRNRISDFDDWVRMDFEYIDNWSVWLDCKILLWTVWAVVAGTGE